METVLEEKPLAFATSRMVTMRGALFLVRTGLSPPMIARICRNCGIAACIVRGESARLRGDDAASSSARRCVGGGVLRAGRGCGRGASGRSDSEREGCGDR